MDKLSHINEDGAAVMVDVSKKEPTSRTATAMATLHALPKVIELIASGGLPKGDAMGVARVAGIMAIKKTSELVPLCHPLFITGCEIDFEINHDNIVIYATVRCDGKTGVEMEALTGASIATLTLYDMCKAVDKTMTITDVCVTEKKGGQSGHYIRDARK